MYNNKNYEEREAYLANDHDMYMILWNRQIINGGQTRSSNVCATKIYSAMNYILFWSIKVV